MASEAEPLSDDEAFALLYRCLCFLVCLYLVGDVFCQRGLRIVPALVGQIVVGLIFGPDGADWLVTDAAHLMLSTAGQLGLVLMLCQAGSQMDLELLKQTGMRSAIMAVTGSFLPTAIGFALAYGIVLEESDWKAALAVGCSFGPTSAGIALAVLEQCNVLQTPIGQLVVAVAIVDDILALVILSQLRALTQSDVSVSQIIIPIVSALLWLGVGSFVAIQCMPTIWERLGSWKEKSAATEAKSTMHEDGMDSDPPLEEGNQTTHAGGSPDTEPGMFSVNQDRKSNEDLIEDATSMDVTYAAVLLLVFIPATYYSEASFFLGAFLAGLGLATRPQAAEALTKSWKSLMDWLMRLFFGATIAFAIPVSLWWEQPKTLAYGCLLALALTGKLAVGPLLTPVLQADGRRWDAVHVRDCLIAGCSMAGEAEFAFVLAAFGLNQGLIPESVYASVTFAILLSTVVSPVLLRLVLAYAAPAR
eukprot:scaffold982_cov169-Amphora_coffeaeformis.AAC.17